jgi:hypothetical protein
LELSKAAGNRADMAITNSQLGVVYTELGQVEKAIPFNLRSIELNVQIGSPGGGADIDCLVRQREALGAHRFRQIVSEHFNEENAAVLLEFLSNVTAKGITPD